MSVFSFSTFGSIKRIAPSDATIYAPADIKRLIVDAVGTLALVDQGGNSVTLAAVVVGQSIPLNVKQVLLTGTTATVVALT